MNNIDYLNKITSENQPKKSSSDSLFSSLFSSKPLRIFLIAAAALAFIIIIVGILSNATGKEKSVAERLNYRLTNINSTVSSYNPLVKSPALRSAGTSLLTELKGTSLNLAPALTSYDYNPKKPNTKILNSETTLNQSFNKSLTDAKLNGMLDRTYAREVAYQISLLIALETELMNKTSNNSLKTTLKTSIENLDTLYPNFNDFSETK